MKFLVQCDIDIIDKANRYAVTAFSDLEKEAQIAGLEVNVDKTKYLLSISKGTTKQFEIIKDKQFEIIKDLVYLGTSVNANNNISLEIHQ